MTKRLLPIIIIAIASLPANTSAQHARVVPPVDTVRVGELVRLGIVAEYPAAYDLDLPRPSGDEPATLGDFELYRLADRVVTTVDHHRIRDSLVFEGMTFALDSATIGGMNLYLVGPRDTAVVTLGTTQVPVAPSWQEGDPPRDLAPIVDVPDRRWVWGLVALAVLAVAVMLWMRHRARRPGAESISGEPPLEPIEEARLRLRQLGADLPSDSELQHGFAIELTDIIRTYIARRLKIPAHEMTSHEILEHPSISVMLEPSAIDAARLLDLADRIKFARAEATGPMLKASIEEAQTWLSEMERHVVDREKTSAEVPA